MKHLAIIGAAISFLASSAFAAEEVGDVSNSDSKSLMEKMNSGGLSQLNAYLEDSGNWPKITTKFFAAKSEIKDHSELIVLSDRLIALLRERVEKDGLRSLNDSEAEAKLFFSLGGKLWKADGFRNRSTALMCMELGSYRCAEIVLMTGGKNKGPSRPDVSDVQNSSELALLFQTLIAEDAILSNSGLAEMLVKEPVQGDTWLDLIEKMRSIEIGGITVGSQFNENVDFRMDPLGDVVRGENISGLVFHYGWSDVIHDSILPALSICLMNGGTVESLLDNPANGRKYNELMKADAYRFPKSPVMSGRVSGGQLVDVIAAVRNSSLLGVRIFGSEK